MEFSHSILSKLILSATALILASCTFGPATLTGITPTAADSGTDNSKEERLMPQTSRTLNIAHRGARSLAPENTLAAARKGLAVGADGWELDVAMTKDGELVVLHDDTLERTSNVAAIFPNRRTAPIQEFTLAELRQLDFGSWFIEKDPFKQIAAGAVTGAELEKYKGEPIPTLREALVFTRDNHWMVNVEIKDATGTPSDAVIVQKTVALIDELNMVQRVIVSSFNHAYLQQVKSFDPTIVTAALVETADPDPAALLKRIGAQAYNPSVKVIQPNIIRSLREAGFDVYIWTVNDEPTFNNLIGAGASGIITDFPQLLKTVLDKGK